MCLCAGEYNIIKYVGYNKRSVKHLPSQFILYYNSAISNFLKIPFTVQPAICAWYITIYQCQDIVKYIDTGNWSWHVIARRRRQESWFWGKPLKYLYNHKNTYFLYWINIWTKQLSFPQLQQKRQSKPLWVKYLLIGTTLLLYNPSSADYK